MLSYSMWCESEVYGRDRKGRKRKDGKIAQCSFHLRQYSNCDDDDEE
jgi:hypothetical protein